MTDQINVNSNWKGNSSGKIVNVDSLINNENGDWVVFHTVMLADGSAPEPNQWGQVTMPRAVFVSHYQHWID